MSRPLRIGSRGSDLALWQARFVASRLGSDIEIVVITTAGDTIQHLSLDKVEGKGFFTKEIEAALLSGEVDVAVHSYKDLPTEGPPGLVIAAVPPRAPVEDVLLVHDSAAEEALPLGIKSGARVGTSSFRRKAQLSFARPDLQLVDLRGNVPTRAGKVEKRELDAVVLAAAGLERLELLPKLAAGGVRASRIPLDLMLPAAAQGALAVQIRQGDAATQQRVAALHDPLTAAGVATERALLSRFGGGCHLPLGAFCVVQGQSHHLRAVVAAPDGSAVMRAEARGTDPAAVVAEVHAALVSQGAGRYV